VTVEEMCAGEPWPSLCELFNHHPVPWVVAAMAVAVALYLIVRSGWGT